jgi:hypothetical protein
MHLRRGLETNKGETTVLLPVCTNANLDDEGDADTKEGHEQADDKAENEAEETTNEGNNAANEVSANACNSLDKRQALGVGG